MLHLSICIDRIWFVSYDMVMTHALEWPSLTVQWLPGQYVFLIICISLINSSRSPMIGSKRQGIAHPTTTNPLTIAY